MCFVVCVFYTLRYISNTFGIGVLELRYAFFVRGKVRSPYNIILGTAAWGGISRYSIGMFAIVIKVLITLSHSALYFFILSTEMLRVLSAAIRWPIIPPGEHILWN